MASEIAYLPTLAQYPQWVRGPAHIVEDQVVLDTRRAEPYFIHEADNDLMFAFARLAADLDNLDERDVLAFVRRYGLLWHGAEDLSSGKCSEPLAEVWAEARFFLELLELYANLRDSVRSGSAGPLRTAKIDFSRYFGHKAADDETLMAQASLFLGEQVTEALEGCTHGVVSTALDASSSSPDRFLLSINPPNLLSLAYVRFAQVIVDRAPMVECSGCGQTFIPESGKQKYCTKSCASTSRWRRWKENQTNKQGT